MAVPTFVDRVTLRVIAGRGGNGVASVHREKFKPLGGPDGGNGGHGGSVYVRAVEGVNSLVAFAHQKHWRAERGSNGEGSDRSGRGGQDLSRLRGGRGRLPGGQRQAGPGPRRGGHRLRGEREHRRLGSAVPDLEVIEARDDVRRLYLEERKRERAQELIAQLRRPSLQRLMLARPAVDHPA